MTTTILASVLLLSGLVYLFATRKEAPRTFWIGLITFVNLIAVGCIPLLQSENLGISFSNFYWISFLILLISLLLGWIIQTKNLQKLSWVALAIPALYFMVEVPAENEKITALTYVQVAGLGAVFPLMIHFLSIFISNFAPPSSTPLKSHKQLISLLLGLAVLGFLVIVANFIFGKEAIYLLAAGIFSTSILFSGYNLNGQISFPTLVFLLLGLVLFSQFQEVYNADLNMGMYQLFSGFLFGISAVFVSALCSSWGSESQGVFSKILLAKAVLAPLVFVFLSGFLFFVYEAFGGRLSLSATLLASAFALPILNQIFENRTYGAVSLIFGGSILLMPMLQHNKTISEVEIVSDTLETNLQKLTYVNENGESITTSLNDLSIAQGKWKIDSENSIIEFKVFGNESVTDGFFKGFSGDLNIAEDFHKTVMNVDIPIATISTFNKMRDKSIRQDEIFFNEDKFPKIQYQVSAVRVENEEYTADGLFIMKGIQAPVKTNFTFVSKGTLDSKEVLILEGKGELNRTAFGQSSDASIGDLVSFTFKAIYSKE